MADRRVPGHSRVSATVQGAPVGRRLLLSVTVLVVAFSAGVVGTEREAAARLVSWLTAPLGSLVAAPPAAGPADAIVADFPMELDEPGDDGTGGDRAADDGGTSDGDARSSTGAARSTGGPREFATVPGSISEQLLALANQARADAGLSPLAGHPDLDAVAQAWSDELAASGQSLAHNPAYAEQIPGGWSAAGENVAWISDGGRLSESEVAARIHQGWMDSPGHRANILNPRFTHLGVGAAHNPRHGYYLTQNFARY